MRTTSTFIRDIITFCEKHGFDPLAADGSGLQIKTPDDSSLMDLHITAIGVNRIALNHTYYSKPFNEPIFDPEIVFWRWQVEGKADAWLPYVYEQQNLGIYHTYVIFDKNDKPSKIRKYGGFTQAQLASFCHTWHKNIVAMNYLDDKSGYEIVLHVDKPENEESEND